MKVLILDTNHPLLKAGLIEKGFTVEEDYVSDYNSISEKIDEFDGIVIRSRVPMDKALLSKATKLKFIARVGAGMENIDVVFAKRENIHLFNAPEGNRDAVAEHALGMLLLLMHRIKIADAEVRQSTWKREENRGNELMGKTVGIVGYGVMGKAFAKRLCGFGVEVVFYDILDGVEDENATEVSLERLFEITDVLSLHVPLTEKTNQMVNADFLEQFKKPIYLINTARGKCVNTHDLVAGLKKGAIVGACLDVLEYESKSFDLQSIQNEDWGFLKLSEKIVLTPHIAGWSHQSNEKMAKVILGKIKKVFG